MKKSKPQQALLCQSIKRSGGTAGALIMRQTQEERGAGLGGENTPAHEAHKKTLTHRCKDTACKCVDMDILCMHNHTLSHAHACMHCHMQNTQRRSL